MKKILIIAMVFTGCTKTEPIGEAPIRKYESIRSITIIDINGDTIRITGGATCHLDKKL